MPGVDGSTVTELRSRLQLSSDRELRQFWRGSGVRLTAARATNALHVLAVLEGEDVPPAAIRRHTALLSINPGQLLSGDELMSDERSEIGTKGQEQCSPASLYVVFAPFYMQVFSEII